MVKHGVLAVLGAVTLAAIADASNVISVTTAGGGTASVIDNERVELTHDGDFTISADDNSTDAVNDGFINSITFGAGATNGDYRVRIATLSTGTIYTTGARYVGYADINSGSKRGSLAMVVLAGQWGKKVVSGTVTDVSPGSGELTRVFEVYRISGDTLPRFAISTVGGVGGSGNVATNAHFTVGGAGSNGWNLATDIGADLVGSIATEGSAPVSSSSFSVIGNLSGSVTSESAITASITVGLELSGSIIANADGNASTSTGDLNGPVSVGSVSSTGVIRAKTKTVGGTVTGGEIQKHVDIVGDFSGTIEAESSSALGPNAWIRINVDGMLPGTWNSGGSVIVAGTTYSTPATYDTAKIYWISHLRGDLDGSRTRNNFDINPYVQALLFPDVSDPGDENYPGYRQTYPWLWESRVYHGDMGPVASSVCTPDGLFNNFDSDCFVNCIVNNACPN